MTVQEVMLRAVSGELHWFQAATSWGGYRGRCGAGGCGMRSTAMPRRSTSRRIDELPAIRLRKQVVMELASERPMQHAMAMDDSRSLHRPWCQEALPCRRVP